VKKVKIGLTMIDPTKAYFVGYNEMGGGDYTSPGGFGATVLGPSSGEYPEFVGSYYSSRSVFTELGAKIIRDYKKSQGRKS